MVICLIFEDLQALLLRAYERQMSPSDYVFLYYAYHPESREEVPWEMKGQPDGERAAFYSLKRVSLVFFLGERRL